MTPRILVVAYVDRRHSLARPPYDDDDFQVEEFHLYAGAPEIVTVAETVETERFSYRKFEYDYPGTTYGSPVPATGVLDEIVDEGWKA